jgi:hypothetical protein
MGFYNSLENKIKHQQNREESNSYNTTYQQKLLAVSLMHCRQIRYAVCGSEVTQLCISFLVLDLTSAVEKRVNCAVFKLV